MRHAVKSAPPPGGDRREFVMSDDSVDRMGDVIEPSGWDLSSFKAGSKFNPIALFNHKADQVVGSWSRVRVQGKQLVGQFDPLAPGTSELADSVRKMIEQDVLRAVSVGFEPIEREKLNDKADEHFGPWRFKKQTLLECSIVSVPANPNAVAIAKSLNLSNETVAEIFGEPARSSAALTGKPAFATPVRKSTTMNTTLTQKINAAHQQFNLLREALKELSEKPEEDFSEEERQRYKELPDQIDAAKAELERQLAVEKRLMDATTGTPHRSGGSSFVVEPPPQSAPIMTGELLAPERPQPERRIFAAPRKLEAGDRLLSAIAVWAKSQATKDPIEKTFREMHGSDELTFAVLRAAVNPAMTSVATWAAELTTTENVGFIDRLIPEFIWPKLAAKGVRYIFGNAAVLKIPGRAATPTLAGSWVGEGAPKPVRRASFTTVSLTPNKLAVISTFTEEMGMYSNPAIEGIIRQGMSDDTGVALDTYLIDNVAASAGVRPAGLLNGVTPITASAATPATAAMVADLKALIGALTAAGGGREIVILLNPAQAMSLLFAQTTAGDFLFASRDEAASKFNVSFIVSITVPAGRVIAIDAADFATAAGDAPRFAVSTEATLHEEDTTPLALSATGTPNVVAAPMRSLFQTDAVAVRMTLYIAWAMRRANMVQTIASVTW